jgi:AAA domain-containing protein
MAFENQLLAKLFEGVLENREITIRNDLTPMTDVVAALERLPISLSSCQRDAVANAWSSEISYVQGPPGTGKSHTITAMMLSAVFLKKRVLMVSHKRPAVEVVRRKLEEFLGQGSVIYLGPLTEQKKKLRGELQTWLAEAGTLAGAQQIRQKRIKRGARLNEVERLLKQVQKMESELKAALQYERDYFRANEAFLKKRTNFEKDYAQADNSRLRFADRVHSPDLLRNQLDRAHRLLQETRSEMAGLLPRKEWLHLRRFFNTCTKGYFADQARLIPDPTATLYLQEHFDVTLTHQTAVMSRMKVTEDLLHKQRRALTNRLAELEREKAELLKTEFACHVLDNIEQSRKDVQRFDRLLHWRNPHRIAEVMDVINYDSLTNTFPLWLGEMRHLGEFLPFISELFDLVIVDEASQVNIAEIIPAFYRGKRFCIVGDKKQLGLSAAGLFALNRTFEQLIWSQHFSQHGVSHVQADERSLLVSKSSILDFITSTNSFSVQKAVLNEHFRSLPQLASFTSDQFYEDDGGLLLMKETPKNVRKDCFQKMEVGGRRDPDNKVVECEVNELFKWLKFLIRGRGYLEDARLSQHGFKPTEPPTIGVISFLTNQRNYIQTRVDEEFQDD